MKFFLCLLLLGSALSFKIHHPIKSSGFFEGSNIGLPGGNIYGGEEAGLNQFPHQAGVFTSRGAGQFVCGGVLISADWVLTAAHCIDAVTSVDVLLGAHNRVTPEDGAVEYSITDMSMLTMHADYNSTLISDDIGVIRLSSPVAFTDAIQAIPLTSSEPPVGEEVTLSGWGVIDDSPFGTPSSTLNFALVPIADDEVCYTTYGPDLDMDNILCLSTDVSGTSSCGGDSGGPMTYSLDGGNVVAGLTSFGASTGCTRGFPIGYVSVARYLDWIAEHTSITP